MLQLPVLIEVADLEGLREILSEEVGCSGLQSFAIAHHGFYRKGDVRTGEFLRIGFLPRDHRDGGIIHRKVRINV